MNIRHIQTRDAERFLHLIQQIDSESEFMLYEAGERKTTLEQQQQKIRWVEHDDHSTILVAEKNHQMIGFLEAIGGKARRNRHTVYLVIGILKKHRGQGVGVRLFQQLEAWAVKRHIHRLELTVVIQNKAALALYRKMGFEIEGRKRDSLLIRGEYADEYYMSKLL
ncbi:GNAT family N-acetyltransferase [Melghirimyces algeriensis]|uniref:Protein N-acetyltransferase, RimJ/RimL family n=1 Tax=Melghirimyces algeriensis TaxID=910412 RepID=A0A521BP63_9BACL|nr:GNAT family N-acetyltransferase [Melghirimyces algeriensis]SMO48561.1 Protein N-acetyltransferase, RimJ/RimL family [Melghirimyces algeriensis]